MISEKIVAVDDDARVIRSLKMALPEFEIMGFNNGHEALSYINRPNDIKVVMLDVMMPGIDGISLLERIKKINKEIAVIMMTAYGSQDIVVQALRHHADDFLEKPFDLGDIKDKIRNLLREKIGAHPQDFDKNVQVERIKRFVERNYTKSSLEYIAGELCLSTKYISRMFRFKNGSNFRDYKLNIKMDKAKEYLANSSYSVTEISDRLGYMNPESFMRVFKRKTKLTPSEYREKYERKRK